MNEIELGGLQSAEIKGVRDALHVPAIALIAHTRLFPGQSVGIDGNTIWDTFGEAEIIQTVSPAADQDGYDGGYVARSQTAEAWGKTPEAAKLALSAAQNELTKP